MNYAETLRLLDLRQEAKWKLGLSRIERILAALGNPQDETPCIHAAGTNGKGSFCAMLASVLSAAGYRTGLNTSPHLRTPRERIKVDGEMILEEDFAAAVSDALAAEPEEATYFELMTAAAFRHFRKIGADFAVIETGMGGRLDATNTVKMPLLSVITSISFDHEKHLGGTLAAIAAEKAGIIRPGGLVLTAEKKIEPLAVIRREARERKARLIEVDCELDPVGEDWESGRQTVRRRDGRLYELSLMGGAARLNATLVLRAVDELRAAGFGISDQAVVEGLKRTRWPGRFEVRREGSRILVLDGAHNPAAMKSFVDSWDRSGFSRREATFIVSILEDKDVDAVLAPLASVMQRVICCEPPSPRALAAEELAAKLEKLGVPQVLVVSGPEEALEAWRRSKVGVCAMVGSFYSLGRVAEAVPA